MILLDTTVLVYAAGWDHPLREPCRRLLEAHGRRWLRCTTTVEVIQEVTHVHARGRTRADAATLARRYAAAFDLLTTGPPDLRLGLELYEAHPRLGSFDAVLAAVVMNHDLTALVSADEDFAGVPDLRWIDPAAALTRLS